MTQKTVLNDAHRRFGAKMVDFGGWDMPLHYGSQLEEHHTVRRDCGMFDVSHMCAVDIAGADAKDFLLRLIANNVEKLKLPGKALYSAMLNEAGGVVDDLIVYFIGEGQYRMVINAGTAEKDLAWMAARLADWKLDVAVVPRRDLAIVAVQGPNAKAKVWEVLPASRAATEGLKPFFGAMVGDYFIATTGYTGEDGFEITLPASQAEAFWQALADAGVKPIGLGARDTLRLEASMPLYGHEMNDEITPKMAGLPCKLTGKDFIGRDALVALGAPKMKRIGMKVVGRGIVREHCDLYTMDGEKIGWASSGTFAPYIGCGVAMGYIPVEDIEIGKHLNADVRGRMVELEIVPMPFYKLER